MLKQSIYTALLFISAATALKAQEKETKAVEWTKQEFVGLQLRELNPVFLNLIPFKTVGETWGGGHFTAGGFRRPQEAADKNQLVFQSQRYQQLNKARAYGSFRFANQWENGVTLANVLDPYRGNPYIIADSTTGNWKKQLYELKGGIAAEPFCNDRLSVGMDLQYNVSTGARQMDPRPVSYSNDLSVKPAASWKLNDRHTIAVNGKFNFYSEEVQIYYEDPVLSHNLFYLKGPVEIIEGEQLGSFNNFTGTYSGKTSGAGFQYVYQQNNWLMIAGVSMHQRTEDFRKGIENPKLGGKLTETGYEANGLIQKTTTRSIQKVELKWKQEDRTGTEYHQTLDDKAGTSNLYYTVFSANFASDLSTLATAKYSWMRLKNTGYDWMINGEIGFRGMDNRYAIVRNMLISDVMNYQGAVAYNMQRESSAVFLQARAGYQQKLTSKTVLATPEKSTFIYNALLYPDQAWLGAEWVRSGLTAMYTRNFKSKADFFIKGSADWILPMNNNDAHTPKWNNRRMFQFSIGAFY